MFLQQHKSRLISALALFAAFIGIGMAAQTANITNTVPAASLTASPRQEVKVVRAATYSSLSVAVDSIETVPAVTVEEPVFIAPSAAPAESAPAKEPYLHYYEAGHFAPGEDGVLISAEGEELHYSSVIQVSATAYTTERQENKITATGTVAHVGGIAVDPRVIPYGTRMYIVSEAGAWAYGYAVAEDCGGGIKGNKVDLFLDTYDECIQFGVRNALIYILED